MFGFKKKVLKKPAYTLTVGESMLLKQELKVEVAKRKQKQMFKIWSSVFYRFTNSALYNHGVMYYGMLKVDYEEKKTLDRALEILRKYKDEIDFDFMDTK